jgi:hypothetical protein
MSHYKRLRTRDQGEVIVVPYIPDGALSPKYPRCNFCLGNSDFERPDTDPDQLCIDFACAVHQGIAIYRHELPEYRARRTVAKINSAGEA